MCMRKVPEAGDRILSPRDRGKNPGAHMGPETHHVLTSQNERSCNSQGIGQRIQEVIGAKLDIG